MVPYVIFWMSLQFLCTWWHSDAAFSISTVPCQSTNSICVLQHMPNQASQRGQMNLTIGNFEQLMYTLDLEFSSQRWR